MVQIGLLHLHVSLEHGVFFEDGVHLLRLLQHFDLCEVLLPSHLFQLGAHHVKLLLEQVNLTMLTIDERLLAVQVLLHRQGLFLED